MNKGYSGHSQLRAAQLSFLEVQVLLDALEVVKALNGE